MFVSQFVNHLAGFGVVPSEEFQYFTIAFKCFLGIPFD